MPRQPILSALLFLACSTAAQVTTTAQNITVQVSTAEPWTDSGLDLKPGSPICHCRPVETQFATSLLTTPEQPAE